MSRVLCIMLVALLIPIVGQVQEEKHKVSLNVTADETIKPQVLSCMRNALGNIRDVQVDDKSYDYKLLIAVATYSQKRDNTKIYFLSYIVIQSITLDSLKNLFITTMIHIIFNKGLFDKQTWNKIVDGLQEDTTLEPSLKYYSIPTFQFQNVSLRLKDLCQTSIAAFDNNVLAEHRNQMKNIKEFLEKYKLK